MSEASVEPFDKTQIEHLWDVFIDTIPSGQIRAIDSDYAIQSLIDGYVVSPGDQVRVEKVADRRIYAECSI